MKTTILLIISILIFFVSVGEKEYRIAIIICSRSLPLDSLKIGIVHPYYKAYLRYDTVYYECFDEDSGFLEYAGKGVIDYTKPDTNYRIYFIDIVTLEENYYPDTSINYRLIDLDK